MKLFYGYDYWMFGPCYLINNENWMPNNHNTKFEILFTIFDSALLKSYAELIIKVNNVLKNRSFDGKWKTDAKRKSLSSARY